MNVTIGKRTSHYHTVCWDAKSNAVLLIDQRQLPHKFEIVPTLTYVETAAAIRDMVVRGAGAIGATAAYGLAQGVCAWPSQAASVKGAGNKKAAAKETRDFTRFQRHVQTVYKTLATARPTAVDPVNAMDKMLEIMSFGKTVQEQKNLVRASAEAFANQDIDHCLEIGRHGANLIRNGMNVLTHCNAGWLAFVDVGTATAPLYEAHAQGRKFHVFCDETRPRSQGATLTAWELAQQNISHQIIPDNAAGHLMQRGHIDIVIVGSDRTLGRTGDVANKIGTYTKAVLANLHGIPFYVAIPLSTIDWNLKSGLDIPIEERHESEVLGAWGVVEDPTAPRPSSRTAKNGKSALTYVRVANPSSGAFNPGFDVTPAELITGIITPAGIFKPRELWRNRHQLGGPA
jgi:methylthioribose-1-phosphate isomerase